MFEKDFDLRVVSATDRINKMLNGDWPAGNRRLNCQKNVNIVGRLLYPSAGGTQMLDTGSSSCFPNRID